MERWRRKIAREYGQLVKTRRGITVQFDQSKAKAKVKTVVPLDDEAREKLGRVLKELTGKDVELNNVIDPSILGGMIVQMGDTIIDMSLATRLNELEERIHAEIARHFDNVKPERSGNIRSFARNAG
ncbi:MAG: F0F1 ATP synthase subunit delta [Firmicutes bacterium]|nr:F0F1 ATP synthase subunit delta [Bacillota bacterium]